MPDFGKIQQNRDWIFVNRFHYVKDGWALAFYDKNTLKIENNHTHITTLLLFEDLVKGEDYFFNKIISKSKIKLNSFVFKDTFGVYLFGNEIVDIIDELDEPYRKIPFAEGMLSKTLDNVLGGRDISSIRRCVQ